MTGFWLAIVMLWACPAYAIIDVSLQMQLGNPSGATVNTNNHDHYLVQRSVEALDYSDNLGEPVWASWNLTAGDVGPATRSTTFYTDSNLPPNFYWVTDNDYNGVGTNNLNRGHMCPSEDRTDTEADNDAVFLMSNIIPQNGTNNSGVWAAFEDFCRKQTTSNEVLIICGPSGFGTNRIPSGKAVIPDYVWKIAVFVPTNSGTALSRITATNRVIALKIPNTFPVTNKWQNFVTSAAQIEVDTGFTFFTALDPAIAAVLRNKVDGQTNPPPVVSTFSPASGMAGTAVVIAGTNFAAASAVTFNGVSTTFTVDSSSQITAVVPPNSNTGFISVTTPSGTTVSSNSFFVIGGVYSFSGMLIGWDMSGVTNYGSSPMPPTTNNFNLTSSGLTRGSGVVTNSGGAARAWGGVNFTNITASLAIAANKFATFSTTVNAGYQVSFSSISRFDYRRSGTGPTNGVLQFQIGSGPFIDITNLNYSVVTSSSGSGGSIGAIDLAGFTQLQNISAGTSVTFRIVNYLGTGSGGSWYISDVAGTTAPDLALQGTITQLSAPVIAPGFQNISLAGEQISLTITGAVATSYTISAATNLLNPQWMPLLTTNPVVMPFTFVDTNLLSQRFYRVQNP